MILLRTPNVERVRAACGVFDKENKLPEDALSQLLDHFPYNSELAHVLLKVVVLNRLYSTNILDVWTVARHITEHNIDKLLGEGSPRVVDLISKVRIREKVRNNFSFGTKYCSWHNPEAYAIYDRNVDAALWAYRQQDSFFTFTHNHLWIYETFLKTVGSFREHYDLGSFTFKEIDKFLWATGKEILDSKAAANPRADAASTGN